MTHRWHRMQSFLALVSLVGATYGFLAFVAPRPALAIVNGQIDVLDEFNNACAVVVTVPDFVDLVFASCTLVDERVVLTAGHATHFLDFVLDDGQIDLDDIFISFSPTDALLDPSTWLPVSALHTHPEFHFPADLEVDFGFPVPHGGLSDVPDIGAIVMAEPVSDRPLVRLPEPGMLDALLAAGQLRRGPPEWTRLIIVGYGSQWVPGAPPPFPDGARRFAEAGFQTLHTVWLFLNGNDALGFGSMGPNDSGGPVFYTDDAGRRTQVAINSWGSYNNARYYRVDSPEALDFISAVLGDLGE